MAAKIRVYELGRELGLSNAETLELCDALGIGAKSHSSSIVDAQADRVRRKAEREGLIREVQPEEEAPEKKAPAKKKAAVSSKKPPKKAAANKEPEAAAPEAAPAEPAVVEAPVEAPVEPEVEAAPAPEPVAEAPAEAPAVDAALAAELEPDQQMPKGIISSKPSRRPVADGPVPPPPTATPKPAPKPKAEGDAPAAEASAPPAIGSDPKKDAPPAPPKPGGGPLSQSGKPIPPPPGPPRSQSGKPIPPPPGRPGGPRNAPAGAGGARPGGYSGGPPRSGGGGARPGGPRTVPGAGAPPAGGGGGRPGGGRPGGPAGRRPPKRKGRRRRNREELQPMNVPSYSSEDAPVPTGMVVIERSITPLDLGPKFNRTAADVVRFMMQQGEMVTATQSLSDELISAFAEDLGAEVKLVDPGEEQEVELRKMLGIDDVEEEEDAGSDDPIRPPVITIMGHVDHGKTKLLDQIRKANVVDGEAGGITQHIGAYQTVRNDHTLTFIDTPGHAAFTAMRSRGAKATDIVILVVAADDGMMPQTIEALNHAKAANVPIIVAINKIDRENANPQRVLSQLTEHELIPESFGGDTIVQEISALQNIGIDELLDQIILVAEIEDLRADPTEKAQGVVLESNLDVGRGPVATVLVQEGTLRVGDPMVAGAAWGRVRALINDKGENIKEAGPSTPVQVLGLSDVADAGREFNIAPSEKVASKVADTREHHQRQSTFGTSSAATSGGARLEDIFEQIQRGEAANLNLIIKADVNGSLEAVIESLRKLETPEVKPTFVHRGVGGITENDIALAATTNATIIGFNVRPDRKARASADAEGVEIRTYEIIYSLLEDVESAMVGMLAPEYEEIVTGDAEVREIFSVPKIGRIAGCYVTNGVITRNSKVRFIREGTIIWKGEVKSLRRFKDDAKEVAAGYECGIGLSDFQDLRDGDIIETYEEREIERSIS